MRDPWWDGWIACVVYAPDGEGEGGLAVVFLRVGCSKVELESMNRSLQKAHINTITFVTHAPRRHGLCEEGDGALHVDARHEEEQRLPEPLHELGAQRGELAVDAVYVCVYTCMCGCVGNSGKSNCAEASHPSHPSIQTHRIRHT